MSRSFGELLELKCMGRDLNTLVKVLGFRSNIVPINLKDSIGNCIISHESDPLGDTVTVESPSLKTKFIFMLSSINHKEPLANAILCVITESRLLLLPKESCIYVSLYLEEDRYKVGEYYIEYVLEDCGKFVSKSILRQFWNLRKMKIIRVVSCLYLNLQLGTVDIPEYPMTTLSIFQHYNGLQCKYTKILRGEDEIHNNTDLLDSELVFWKIVEGTIYDWYEINK